MHKLITKARAALILSQPFFGALALRLKVVEAPGIETMAVDGVHLFYNRDFVEALTFDELTGVIAHEVMHLATGHHARREARHPKRWNKACDYAINPIVRDAGFKLPEDALLETRFDGLAAEAIYNILDHDDAEKRTSDGQSKDPRDGRPSPGDGGSEGAPSADAAPDPGRCGGVMDTPAPDGGKASPAELNAAKNDWDVAVLQAAQYAKAAGDAPAGLDRLIEEIKRPKIDWRAVLRRFVDRNTRNDYRWSRPNRRYIGSGLYLPSLHSDGVGRIVIAVDTSLSIDPDILSQFAAEMNAIVEDCRPEAVDVVYCDAGVARVEHFGADDLPLTINPAGGGGTSFVPPFEWVEEQAFDPACFIYLTDLYGRFPDQAPFYPLLWASTSDKNAPFGETLKIDN